MSTRENIRLIARSPLLFASQVLKKSKARSTALASAVKIDESSGIRCILLWLSDITARLLLTHQYKFVGNSYNDFEAF